MRMHVVQREYNWIKFRVPVTVLCAHCPTLPQAVLPRGCTQTSICVAGVLKQACSWEVRLLWLENDLTFWRPSWTFFRLLGGLGCFHQSLFFHLEPEYVIIWWLFQHSPTSSPLPLIKIFPNKNLCMLNSLIMAAALWAWTKRTCIFCLFTEETEAQRSVCPELHD